MLNGLGQGFVRAAATDARAIVRAVSSATQAALALVPGASVRSLKDVTISVREPVGLAQSSTSSGGRSPLVSPGPSSCVAVCVPPRSW